MWSLARVSGRDITWVSLILGVDALIRGLNYMNIDRLAAVLGTVERAFDMQVWGIVFTLTALTVFVGYGLRFRWLLALGHGLTGTLYLGLAAGVASATVAASAFEHDIRTVATFATVAAIHAFLAWKITETRLHWIHIRRRGGSRE